MIKCKRCGRTLTNIKSINSGMGPICTKKHKNQTRINMDDMREWILKDKKIKEIYEIT